MIILDFRVQEKFTCKKVQSTHCYSQINSVFFYGKGKPPHF